MSRFDYVVVGAGSAGAAVAARLSEDPDVSVLLIEAGGSHRHLAVQIPAAFAQQFKTDLDWEYYTEPEPALGGRRVYLPRAKMLGGCSAMNAMIYIRGAASDYEDWSALGAEGWSYQEVLPLFRRAEGNARGADDYHGVGGPLRVEDPRDPNPLDRSILEAMYATGLHPNSDFNGASQYGAGLYQVTQRRGQRWTTADGYLAPARQRPNLRILTHTQVLRVRLDNGGALGVEAQRGDWRGFIPAEAEVILSGGAINTPQLLMLSGIGPADHLAEHGISVAVDNPHVGSHYMDHPMYVMNYEVTARGTLAGAESPVQLARYLTQRNGLLTSNVGEVGGFFRTRSGDGPPDMQFISGPAYCWDHGQKTSDRPAMAIGCSLVGALSEGEVRLLSADPLAKPGVTAHYLEEPADMDSMVAGMERAREVVAAAPLRDIVVRELHPGPTCDRAALERMIRREVEHTYNPSCTARIGSESAGVVAPDLTVHGVTGLRVADASVFPWIPHGNTHAPAVMVGEKAAELIAAGR